MLFSDDLQKVFVIDRDSKVFSESFGNLFAAAAVFTADGNADTYICLKFSEIRVSL